MGGVSLLGHVLRPGRFECHLVRVLCDRRRFGRRGRRGRVGQLRLSAQLLLRSASGHRRGHPAANRTRHTGAEHDRHGRLCRAADVLAISLGHCPDLVCDGRVVVNPVYQRGRFLQKFFAGRLGRDPHELLGDALDDTGVALGDGFDQFVLGRAAKHGFDRQHLAADKRKGGRAKTGGRARQRVVDPQVV